MKSKLFLLAIVGLFFFSFQAEAQVKLPKMDLSSQVLDILDNTKGLGLNSDQESKLKTNNKSFVDELMKITGGSGSDDDKKASILGLKDKRTKFLMDLLGNDLVKKYTGQILKGINPLKSKLGLAALAF
ncbi:MULTISPECIES: hypothetical protein [Algoriphagus]|uniref:DUF3347 domain-containing protein n=2 Tax=Algoriphagus TaxID=246875 RepID=A0A4Y9QXT9_9BACT|nr:MULTISPECIES: hypothetical protein [Algoriphagus]MCS5489047.1 hypothetical protein [Algoriphagus limi]TFV97281.1 hypothetical protein E4S40_01090 [Algoriphagus kandeliae]